MQNNPFQFKNYLYNFKIKIKLGGFNIKTKAFTLVELVIVIAILAILASLSIPIYMRYQAKAKVSSYVLPIVRACAYDAIAHCMSGRLSDENNVTMDVTNFPNCKNATLPVGNLSLNISGSITCEPTGHVSNCTVIGELIGISEYQVYCSLREESLKCDVVSKN